MLVKKEYYEENFKGIAIKSIAEFELLSQRAEQILDEYAFSEIPKWNNQAYIELKEDGAAYQDNIKIAICYEIETLFHAGGTQATTGGADAGRVPLLNGVPVSGLAKAKLRDVLDRNNLIYRGI